MNEELDKLLIDSLTQAKGAVTTGIDIAMEQAPDLMAQLITYTVTMGVIAMAVALVCVVAFLYVILTLPNRDEFVNFILAVMTTIFFLIAFICVIELDWFKAWLMPKVFIIEYTAKLVS